MNLQEFLPKYREIKSRGFISITRKGDGKFGNTFEDLLGLDENNLKTPDIEGYEIKVQNNTKNSLQTLFNKEGEWEIKKDDFIKIHGWERKKDESELTCQTTITKTKNKRGFYLETDEKNLYVKINNEIACKWNWKSLTKTFIEKFPSAIKVYGEEKKKNGKIYFHYNEAYLLKDTTERLFKQLIEDDIILIDFRFYTRYNEGKGIRNRGTGFRIRENHLDKLFVKEVLE